MSGTIDSGRKWRKKVVSDIQLLITSLALYSYEQLCWEYKLLQEHIVEMTADVVLWSKCTTTSVQSTINDILGDSLLNFSLLWPMRA